MLDVVATIMYIHFRHRKHPLNRPGKSNPHPHPLQILRQEYSISIFPQGILGPYHLVQFHSVFGHKPSQTIVHSLSLLIKKTYRAYCFIRHLLPEFSDLLRINGFLQ